MIRRYGIPYMGSKNAIAERIIASMPPAEHFYDLFAGGCAVTHCALLSGKFRHVHANDLTDNPQVFLDAVNGKFKGDTRWISHDDFSRLKDTDPYVRVCWSFGNNQRTYLYSHAIEAWKKAVHYARVKGDTSLFKTMGIETDGSADDIRRHEKEYRDKYIAWCGENITELSMGSLQKLESQARLTRLTKLQSLQPTEAVNSLSLVRNGVTLDITRKDYRKVDILPNSVVYCDPPYNNVYGHYKCGVFDHEAFYAWARERRNVFISEYAMPDTFECVAAFSKMALFNFRTGSTKGVERLYVPKGNAVQQTDLFGFENIV